MANFAEVDNNWWWESSTGTTTTTSNTFTLEDAQNLRLQLDQDSFFTPQMQNDPHIPQEEDPMFKDPARAIALKAVSKNLKNQEASLAITDLIPEDKVKVDAKRYRELADKFGWSEGRTQPDKLALRTYLQREEIPIYDMERVTEYMDTLITKERLKQKNKQLLWSWQCVGSHRDASSNPAAVTLSGMRANTNGEVSRSIYNKEVPIEALELAAKIKDAIPDACFYVSGYEAPRPDPFLMVMVPGADDKFVISHWDEPGFSLDPRKSA